MSARDFSKALERLQALHIRSLPLERRQEAQALVQRLMEALGVAGGELGDGQLGAGSEGTAPDAGMPQGRLATDPPVSEAQRRAAQAAVHGRSTLGISPSAGKKILGQDMASDAGSFANRFPDAARTRFA
jgi:hypothetical protein